MKVVTYSSFHPFENLPGPDDFAKRERKAPQPSLMLLLVRTTTSILDKPSLETAIERAPSSGITAAVRHNSTHDDPLNLFLLQHSAEVCVDEGVVGIFADDRVAFDHILDLRL